RQYRRGSNMSEAHEGTDHDEAHSHDFTPPAGPPVAWSALSRMRARECQGGALAGLEQASSHWRSSGVSVTMYLLRGMAGLPPPGYRRCRPRRLSVNSSVADD